MDDRPGAADDTLSRVTGPSLAIFVTLFGMLVSRPESCTPGNRASNSTRAPFKAFLLDARVRSGLDRRSYRVRTKKREGSCKDLFWCKKVACSRFWTGVYVSAWRVPNNLNRSSAGPLGRESISEYPLARRGARRSSRGRRRVCLRSRACPSAGHPAQAGIRQVPPILQHSAALMTVLPWVGAILSRTGQSLLMVGRIR